MIKQALRKMLISPNGVLWLALTTGLAIANYKWYNDGVDPWIHITFGAFWLTLFLIDLIIYTPMKIKE